MTMFLNDVDEENCNVNLLNDRCVPGVLLANLLPLRACIELGFAPSATKVLNMLALS